MSTNADDHNLKGISSARGASNARTASPVSTTGNNDSMNDGLKTDNKIDGPKTDTQDKEAKVLHELQKLKITVPTTALPKQKTSINNAIAKLRQDANGILDLSRKNIDDVGIEMLIDIIIKENLNIETLNLSYNKIDLKGARMIADLLEKGSIQHLKIGHNCIGNNGIRAIFSAINSSTSKIRSLNLSHTVAERLVIATADCIAEVISKNKFLQSLNLSGNCIDCHGVKAIAKALPQSQLIVLRLRNTFCGSDAAALIAEALFKSKVQTLDLGYNNIGDSVIPQFNEVLQFRNNPTNNCPRLTCLNFEASGLACVANAGHVAYFKKGESFHPLNILSAEASICPDEDIQDLPPVHPAATTSTHLATFCYAGLTTKEILAKRLHPITLPETNHIPSSTVLGTPAEEPIAVKPFIPMATQKAAQGKDLETPLGAFKQLPELAPV